MLAEQFWLYQCVQYCCRYFFVSFMVFWSETRSPCSVRSGLGLGLGVNGANVEPDLAPEVSHTSELRTRAQ